MTGAVPRPRDWLHRLESDTSVPDYAMQVARIYADYARTPAADGTVWVGWAALRRHTHQHKDKLARSLGWLREAGWLAEQPTRTGGKKRHRLTVPGLPDQSDHPDHSDRPEHSDNHSDRPEQEHSDRPDPNKTHNVERRWPTLRLAIFKGK